MRRRWSYALLGCAFVSGCEQAPGGGDETTVASATPAAVASAIANPDGILLPPEVAPVTNPLELPEPTGQPTPEKGQRIFAVPREMLETARLGSALKLVAAEVLSREGENFIVEVGYGAPYQIHPAYVVVPRVGAVRRDAYVVASYNGEMRHGVVKHVLGDRATVQFTDLGFKAPDQKLDPKRVGVLPVGLAPGGYAAYLDEHEYRHVVLLSSSSVAGKERWLVLHHTGECELVPAEKLKALPVPRFQPKIGAPVLAAYRGTMVRAQVTEIERPGLVTVTRARAGRPLVVGPGMIMPTE